jgi:hypothetical protein
MKVEARKDQLLAQPVGDDVVIYDERTQTAHRLNKTAALVWQFADGRRTVPDLTKLLHDAVGAPEEDDNVVLTAISELDRVGLLTRALSAPGEPISRRAALTIAASVVPIITTISVRNAEANCGTPTNTNCPTLAITAPVNGSTVTQGTVVVVTVTIADPGTISNLVVTAGSQTIGSSSNLGGSVSFNWTPSTTGPVTITATGTGIKPVFTPPAVSITVTVAAGITCSNAASTYSNSNATLSAGSSGCALPPMIANGTVILQCGANSNQINMTVIDPTTNRTMNYAGTINPANGSFSASGTGSYNISASVCSVSGNITGTFISSPTKSLNFTEAISVTGCCTGTGTYSWTAM